MGVLGEMGADARVLPTPLSSACSSRRSTPGTIAATSCWTTALASPSDATTFASLSSSSWGWADCGSSVAVVVGVAAVTLTLTLCLSFFFLVV